MRISAAWISVFVILTTATLAQPLQLTLVMSPQPSPYLSDWQTRRETVILSVTNPSTNTFIVRISAKIFQGSQSGTLLAETKVNEMPILEIPPGTSIFNGEDVVPQDAVKFYGGVESSTVRSGRIAAGAYTLCVVLVQAELLQPLTQQKCSGFTLTHHLPPQLYLPTNTQSLTLDQLRTAVFRWSREAPPVQASIAQLVVVEHRLDQPLWQALSANPPVFQTDVVAGLTQFQWLPDVILQPGRSYVWSVRVADAEGRSVCEPEWADPFLFKLVESTDTSKCKSAVLTLRHDNSNPNGVAINTKLGVRAELNVPWECVKTIEWTTHRVNTTDINAAGDVVGTPLRGDATQTSLSSLASYDQLISTPGTYRVSCAVGVGTQTIQSSVDVVCIDNTQPKQKVPCSIIILNPKNPCTGSVETSHIEPTINVTVVVDGPISELEVTIRTNPCGTYTPPTIPTPTTPGGGGTTETPSGGTTTKPSGPITQDKYVEKMKKKVSNPSQGTNTIPIPVGEVITPGGAYVVEVTGVCIAEDGEVGETVSAAPTCDRYRPMATTTTDETPPVPVPIPECPDTYPLYCGPSITSEPATPISATIELEDASLYPYPRAAPLRANTIDWDYAVFHCTGCAPGEGIEWRPVRDLADIISWTLKGKGSLNVPFDAKSIKAVDDEIDKLLARLAAIKDSLAATRKAKEKAIEKFKKDLESAKKQLDEKETEKKKLVEHLNDVVKQLDSAEKAADSLSKKLDSMTTMANRLRDTARVNQDSVVRYDSLLTDPPTEKEKSLLATVGSTQKTLESQDAALKELQRSIAIESDKLQKAIRKTDSLLTIAQQNYKALQESSGSLTRKIADLQAAMYGTPALKAYRTSRRELQQQQTNFSASYPMSMGLVIINTSLSGMLSDVHAALITPDPVERARVAKLVDSVSTLVKALLGSACNPITDTNARKACKSSATDLKASIDKFKTDAKTCLTTGEKVSAVYDASIKKSQGDIAAQEGSLKSAELAVKTAATEHKASLDHYKTKISAMDAERATALKKAEDAQRDHKEAQRVYQAEREHRDSLFRINQPIFLDRRAEFARRRDSARRMIDSIAILFESTRADSLVVGSLIRDLSADTSSVNDSIAKVDADIKRLKEFTKQKESDIAKPFDDVIARLQKDSTDIEKKLEEKKKDRENLSAGSKSAAEEMVYYIPPPLEEIMKDKAKFEALKDSVAKAEGKVKIALAKKEAVQAQLVRLLEGISGDLSEIKTLESIVSNAEEEGKEIDKEAGKKKNEIAKEYREQYDKIDDERIAAEKEEKSADDKVVEAAADAQRLTEELEQHRTDLGKALDELSTARKAVKEAVESRATRLATVQTTSNSSSSTASALNTDRKDLRSAQRTQRKASDETRRAIAREDMVAETMARTNTISANNSVKQKENSIDTKKASLVALSKQLGVQFGDLIKDDTLLAQRLRDFVKADNQATSKKAAYDFTFFKLEKAIQRVEYWRGIRDNAETRKDQQQASLDDMPSADSVTSEDDDVQASEERKEELEKQAEDAKKKIEANKKSITDALAEQDKVIKEADKELEDARKNLVDKNKELRDFLVNEFNTVTHTDTLIIKVKDRVVDGFRAGDALKEVECYIKYAGTRTPTLMCGPLAGAAPPVKKQNGPCIPDIGVDAITSVQGTPPVLNKKEPRTIALIYKEGKPLWPEWPVIEEAKVLAKDVVMLKGEASDNDLFIFTCVPQRRGCIPPPPLKPTVIDLASRTWIKHDGNYHHILERSPYVLWEPDKVPTGVCSNKQLVEAEYRANEIAPDPTDKQKARFDIEPGVLIEIPDSLVGWPKKKDTVVARVVTGDHKGLSGEKIIMTVKLVEGKSEEWGLDGKKKKAERTTDGDGYVKIPFEYGTGFARFEIEVKWSRPDTCKQEMLTAISPLLLRFHRLGNAPPTVAWNAAVKVWGGSGADDVLKGMPEVKEEDDPYEKHIHGVSGFLDENRSFVNDQLMKFTPVAPKYTIDPEEEKTRLFGIARTQVEDEIKEGKLTMKASCEDSLRPVCRPPDSTRTYDPKGEKTFKIGSPDDLFVVEMDEGFDPSDIITGSGKLKIDSPDEFLQSLVDLPLEVEGVRLDKSLVATEGSVLWATGGLSAKIDDFTFTLDKLGIVVNIGAKIEGSVDHESLDGKPVGFSAVLGSDGQFYGEASNLPKVECAGFVLKQGASIAIDFHSALPEKTPLGPAFKGIVIGTAELEFPEAFRVRNTDEPTVLSVTDLAIGTGGVTGKIAIEGGPITISYAKYAISVKKLEVEFETNRLKGAVIEGAFTMDKPFTGTINATITFNEKWIAEFSTESSITIPRWKAAVAILPGTKLEYDVAKKVGTFTLVAIISSDRFGSIDIEELTVSSDGKFAIKGGIKKEVDIKILKGFDLHVTGADIVASNDEFELQIHGSIGIPGIGLKSLKGSLVIKPGPDVDVKIDGGEIAISKGPFELKGKFTYKSNEFYAKLSVEIKNVLKGIEGEIYVGTQPTPDNSTYTYWYVGLTISTMIPLGQSGLAITEIGGGVGWNCIPPIGTEKPTPEYLDNISLRASVGIGNSVPLPGKLFNSRFTMVYVPGSITLAGEAWLLDQYQNIVGSGKLTIAWDPALAITGDVQARLALPDNEGKIVLMRGKIDFAFDANQFKIASEFLDASLMGLLNANAQLLVTKKEGYLKGKVWYELQKSADILVCVITAEFNMTATLDLTYKTDPKIALSGAISFSGNAKLNAARGPFSWDLASASVSCGASVSTVGTKFKLTGTVKAYASVLGFSGNVDYDVGFET